MKRIIEADTVPEWIEPMAVLALQQGAPAEPAPPVPRGGLGLVLSNAGANIARQVSSFLVVLVLPPLLVRSLDRPTYAAWLLVLQIASYITLIDNGVQTVVARYVALERATTGTAGVSRLLSNAIVLLGMVAGVTAATFTLGSPMLAWLIPGQSMALLTSAKYALLITAITAAIALPFSALAGMFAGDQRSEVNAVAVTIGKLAGSVGVAWVAIRHGGLEAMALALAGGTVLQSMLYVGAARYRQTVELFAWRLVQLSYLHDLFTFSIGMMVSQLAGLLISGMDLPLVSAFDFAHAAYYGLALTASNLLLVPFAAIVTAFMPVVTAVHAEGDPVRLGTLMAGITRSANVFLGLLVLLLGTSLPALLHWWVRPDYASHALPLAEILIIAQALRMTCSPYAITGFSTGKQKQMLYSPVGEAIVNLVCSLIGAKVLGAAGVACGTLIGAIAGVLLHMLVSIPRTQDVIQVDRRTFVMRSILRPLASVSPAFPVYLVGHHWATTPVRTLLLSAICGAVALPGAWQWGLDERARTRLSRYLRDYVKTTRGNR